MNAVAVTAPVTATAPRLWRWLTAATMLALAALSQINPARADEPDLIFRRSTVFKLLTPNDKLATYAIDDPVVEGVACHFTVPEKGGFKGWIGIGQLGLQRALIDVKIERGSRALFDGDPTSVTVRAAGCECGIAQEDTNLRGAVVSEIDSPSILTGFVSIEKVLLEKEQAVGPCRAPLQSAMRNSSTVLTRNVVAQSRF